MPHVHLREPLKRLAGNRSEHALEGTTVAEVLVALERAQPALDGWILDERDVLRRHINVFVNGERAEQETAVEAGDRIDVLPAISGGRR
jgi:sulfur-carrier protein